MDYEDSIGSSTRSIYLVIFHALIPFALFCHLQEATVHAFNPLRNQIRLDGSQVEWQAWHARASPDRMQVSDAEFSPRFVIYRRLTSTIMNHDPLTRRH